MSFAVLLLIARGDRRGLLGGLGSGYSMHGAAGEPSTRSHPGDVEVL
jgi:hypothetical protein